MCVKRGLNPSWIVLAGDVTGDVFAEASEHPPRTAPAVAALAAGINVDFAVALDHDFVVVGVFEEIFADLLVCDADRCHFRVLFVGALRRATGDNLGHAPEIGDNFFRFFSFFLRATGNPTAATIPAHRYFPPYAIQTPESAHQRAKQTEDHATNSHRLF